MKGYSSILQIIFNKNKFLVYVKTKNNMFANVFSSLYYLSINPFSTKTKGSIMSNQDMLEMFQTQQVEFNFKSNYKLHNTGESIGIRLLGYLLLLVVATPIGIVLSLVLPKLPEDSPLNMLYVLITIALAAYPYMLIGKRLENWFDKRRQGQRDMEQKNFEDALATIGLKIKRGDVFSFFSGRGHNVVTNQDNVSYRVPVLLGSSRKDTYTLILEA